MQMVARNRRRAAVLHSHLTPSPAPARLQAPLGCSASSEVRIFDELPLPPLDQDDAGHLTPEAVAALEAAEAAAATQRTADGYRLAAQLRGTIETLAPPALGGRPPLALADCAPGTDEQRREFFYRHGFCVLTDVLQGDALMRAQDAWRRADAELRPGWEEEQRRWRQQQADAEGGTYSIPELTERDDVFLELVDHPKLVGLLSHVAGAGGLEAATMQPEGSRYHGTMRMGGAMSGLVVPPNPLGYTCWHHDHAEPSGFPLPSHRNTKVFVALFDIPTNGGCTALVPCTHRLPGCFLPGSQPGGWAGRGLALRRGYRSHNHHHRGSEIDALPQESMPGHVKMALTAGSAFAFDSSTWHTSMPNTSGSERRTALFNFWSSGVGGWAESVRLWGPRPGLSEPTLRRLAAHGKLGRTRRRLLGLPDAGDGDEWHDSSTGSCN
jgi:ectoine hydroxylase-related dioxygenase (phytanoyl-CoA dioxygenase family)